MCDGVIPHFLSIPYTVLKCYKYFHWRWVLKKVPSAPPICIILEKLLTYSHISQFISIISFRPALHLKQVFLFHSQIPNLQLQLVLHIRMSVYEKSRTVTEAYQTTRDNNRVWNKLLGRKAANDLFSFPGNFPTCGICSDVNLDHEKEGQQKFGMILPSTFRNTLKRAFTIERTQNKNRLME